MERRYQVFISSTYTDLIDERREVIQALLEMDAVPAGMEMFPAANEDQWSLIRGVIDASDYYLVIVGGRYGSTTVEGISYTEMEYDYAIESGIPVMGFVHADPDSIPKGKSEMGAEAAKKLDDFRSKVKTRMVKPFSTPSELGSVVSRGLIKLIKNNPREGWVRGSNALTPETQTQIAELRAQVAELKQLRAETDKRKPLDVEGFAQGDDEVQLGVEVEGYNHDDEDEPSYKRTRYIWRPKFPTNWNRILEAVGPSLLNEANQVELEKSLSDFAWKLWNQHPKLQPSTIETQTSFKPLPASVEDVIVQFFTLGIIEHGVKKRAISDRGKYWALTPTGQDQMMRLRAMPRPSKK